MHIYLLYQNLVIRDGWWYQLYEHFVRPDWGLINFISAESYVKEHYSAMQGFFLGQTLVIKQMLSGTQPKDSLSIVGKMEITLKSNDGFLKRKPFSVFLSFRNVAIVAVF